MFYTLLQFWGVRSTSWHWLTKGGALDSVVSMLVLNKKEASIINNLWYGVLPRLCILKSTSIDTQCCV